MQQTVEGYVDMYFSPEAGTRVQANGVIAYILREVSASLLVQLTGHCEGLYKRNGQTVRLSRFSIVRQPNANEESPAALGNNMKIKFLLAFLLSISCISGYALSFDCSYGNSWSTYTLTFTVTDENAKTCSVKSSKTNFSTGDVIIPETVQYSNTTYTVTSIENEAFYFVSMRSVTIPNTVTSIGDAAFSSSCLSSLELSSSLKTIGKQAFRDNYHLKSIDIPESVTSIGEMAFYWCSDVKTVNIPASVSQIGEAAFSRCGNIETINVDPENKHYISADGLLMNKDMTTLISVCDGKLTGRVTIPETITNIGKYAMSRCKNITAIDLPGSLTCIGEYAFLESDDIKEVNYNTVNPVESKGSQFASSVYENATLNIAIGGIEAAKQTEPWNRFANIQEKDFTPVAKEVIVKLPGGNLHFPEEAAGMTVRLTADDDFEFHSATLDDEDISHLVGEQGHFTVPSVEKPTMLNVVFKQNPDVETQINVISIDDEPRVTVSNKRVHINGKDASEIVRAYDLQGLMLKETVDCEFDLNYSGVVILTVGKHTYKFAI